MPEASPTPMLTVEITSFSYKTPLPAHLFSSDGGRHGGGFVFDCRSLPNPGREQQYKLATGLDDSVRQYLEACPSVHEFRSHVFALIDSTIESYLARDFSFLSVGFGCTGGQHRSVFLAEELTRHLKKSYPERVAPVTHHPSLRSKGFLP